MVTNGELRKLPSVDQVLISDQIQALLEKFPRALVTSGIQEVLDKNRSQIMNGYTCPSKSEILNQVVQHLSLQWSGLFKTIINGTGVILHTNIGRAPLSDGAVDSLSKLASGYCNLEYDLFSGKRGVRAQGVEKLICALTGAEDALVVNNNAAAVFLIMTVLARGKDVIISRGELVQIGGGFRIPEIMEVAGAHLKEVGTTNKTFIKDYEHAISEETALLFKVHTSNFAIHGFTQAASVAELRAIGNKYNLPLVYDIGSGALLDTADFGLGHEPMVQEALADNVDLVCFSGDKLLGGPQAGIIVGSKYYLNKLREYPIERAIRIDKMTSVALEATLMHYLRKEATVKIPVWQMISARLEDIRVRAEVVRDELNRLGISSTIQQGESMVGGGSLPDHTLPSIVVVIKPKDSAENLARRLRLSTPAVIGRIEQDGFLIDMRTVLPSLDNMLIEVIKGAFT